MTDPDTKRRDVTVDDTYDGDRPLGEPAVISVDSISLHPLLFFHLDVPTPSSTPFAYHVGRKVCDVY